MMAMALALSIQLSLAFLLDTYSLCPNLSCNSKAATTWFVVSSNLAFFQGCPLFVLIVH